MKERFISENEFSIDWIDRNRELLKQIVSTSKGITFNSTFAEIGSGPFTPFKSLLPERTTCHTYDKILWSKDTLFLDLNQSTKLIMPYNYIILSGVIEYLPDPIGTLRKLFIQCDYISLSYTHFKLYNFLPFRRSQVINSRKKSGFNNHFHLFQLIYELLKFCKIKFRYISRNQVIFLLAKKA